VHNTKTCTKISKTCARGGRMFKNLAAGGQTTAHGVRMLRQVIKIGLSISMVFGLLYFGWFLYQQPQENYKAFYYLAKSKITFEETVLVRAESWKEINRTPKKKSSKKTPAKEEPNYSFASEDTPEYKNRMLKIKKATVIKACEKRIRFFKGEAIEEGKNAGKIFLVVFGLSMLIFVLKGNKTGKKKYVSGVQVTKPWKLKWRLRLTGKASDLTIGGVPLTINSENRHLFFAGVPGVGKTNAFNEMLSQVRKRGDRAVVVDTTGDFVEKFYREGKDIILNPYDQRTVDWSPWAECTKKCHYAQLANAIFPSMHRTENDYFSQAARTVVQAMLEKMALDPNRTIKEFVDALCIQPLSELFDLLQSTPGAAYLDPKGEKGSHSIRTTIINGINDFSLLKESPTPFSVREWILDEEEEDQWLFLSCTEEQRHSLRVLMSIWTSVAVEALKSRNKKTAAEHPIFIAIDELHSLQKLECLKGATAELRKYWGCLMLATQNISQLDSIYGHDVARVIIDSCGTKVCFRQTEKESAKRMSLFFGESQVKETQEGLSYGANDMRDGVTLSTSERTRSVVSSSDIQELPDLAAYLKLSNPPKRFRWLRAKPLPATRVSFKYKSFPSIAEKCIEKDPSEYLQLTPSIEVVKEETTIPEEESATLTT